MKNEKKMIKIVREYGSYSEYIKHQKTKTLDPVRRRKWLTEEWNLKLKIFRNCFIKTLGENLSGKKCLGVCARTGQEIQAFRDLGADAIGIDIVPCEPLVIEGDMHNISFSDNSFDIIFSNSIDHSLYPEKFAREVRRISKPNALVLLHLQLHQIPYNQRKQDYDICDVDDSKSMIKLFGDVEVLKDKACHYFSSNWETLLKVIK